MTKGSIVEPVRVTPPLNALALVRLRVPRPVLTMLAPAPVTMPASVPVMFGALTSIVVLWEAGIAIVVAGPPNVRLAGALVTASMVKLPPTATLLATVRAPPESAYSVLPAPIVSVPVPSGPVTSLPSVLLVLLAAMVRFVPPAKLTPPVNVLAPPSCRLPPPAT